LQHEAQAASARQTAADPDRRRILAIFARRLDKPQAQSLRDGGRAARRAAAMSQILLIFH
jgi:23S rRNA C2498 (ribose-2'-O)-methylase RlmM